jgi:hypothetical protein
LGPHPVRKTPRDPCTGQADGIRQDDIVASRHRKAGGAKPTVLLRLPFFLLKSCLSFRAINFAQKRGNTIEEMTENYYHPIIKQAAHPCT